MPASPAGSKDAAQPGPPSVLGTGRVPCLLGLPHTLTMLHEGSLVSGRVAPVVRVGPQPYFPEQGTGVIRQLHDPHAHPVPRAARAMSALGVSAGRSTATARPPAPPGAPWLPPAMGGPPFPADLLGPH